MLVRAGADLAVAKVAATRAGAFHRDDVRAAGSDHHLIQRRVDRGLWLARGNDVFVLASHPDSSAQRRWVGLLAGGAGAHLSDETAAELHRLDGIIRGKVVVNVRHGHHAAIPGGQLRQRDDVLAHHLTEIDGVPLTTPARTLLDLAGHTSFVRMKTATEDAIARRLTTYGEVVGIVQEVRRRGKPGIGRIGKVLGALAGEPPPESNLERLLVDVIERAGLRAVRQHPLPTHLPMRGLVDFAVVDSKLILEADGRLWHARLQAMANDRQRDREAAAVGWQTLRFMHEDLRHNADGEAASLRATHDRRLRTVA